MVFMNRQNGQKMENTQISEWHSHLSFFRKDPRIITQQNLFKFLNALKPLPQNLIDELNENPQVTIQRWSACTENHWEKIAGIPNGIYIFNYFRQHIASEPELPQFSSEYYRFSLYGLDANGDPFLPLQGRSQEVRQVCNFIRMPQQKLAPVIISTSRGMGKTFLLKKLGANDLGTSESIIELEQAKLNGRTISITSKRDTVNKYSCDYELWLKDVFLGHLSNVFYGYSFRGVCFDVKFPNPLLQDVSKASPSFQKFAGHVKSRSVLEVFDLVMEWTREAFNITSEIRLVVLIDEMQHLLVDMNIKSSVYSGNHTFLSLALSCLKMRRPIIIMTGTNAGEFEMMNDYSDVNPQFVGLSPFELEGSRLSGTLLFQNFGKAVSWTEDDKRLSQAIQTLSAGVPQLLRIGYDSWIRLIESFSFQLIIQTFFVNARSYYKEATDYVRNDSKISDEDLAMVMLCCNSFFQVREIGNYVPGTKISWRQLIHASVVFPCGNSCYCIPSIFWLPKDNKDDDEKIFRVKSLINEKLVPGVDIEVMNLDVLAWYDDRNNWLTRIGHYFETLFGMSLAIRHYLQTYDHRRRKLVKFSDIYCAFHAK